MSQKIEVQGYCDDRFKKVKEVFAENFELGLDVGASLAVTLDGKFVVDLWGGYADAAKTKPWERDTIINVFSTTKIMTTICTLMCVDRGLIDIDAPVAKYWPEFAQNGKADLPVRYLLSHTSGLSGWSEQFPMEGLYDWNLCVTKLAAQKPWWKPGTKSGYHLVTYGYLLGELVRRVTGKSVGTFFRDEVAKPLNADFHIGLSPENDPRVAELIPAKVPLLLKILGNVFFQKLLWYNVTVKTLSKPNLSNIVDATRTRAWRAAEIPAANGQGNARSIARIGAALACGGKLDGVNLLSPAILEKALEEQSYGKDAVLNSPIRFGLGFGLPCKELPFPHPRTLFWGGLGGSLMVMDLDAKMSLGFAMNKMSAEILMDIRKVRFMEVLTKALDVH
ncbi:MAG: beta-lactamase family protein [Candidatus Helarchaeota archaeon]|nr:beta-lactamase family protein [Candidatus Helarchaeota archaeon]